MTTWTCELPTLLLPESSLQTLGSEETALPTVLAQLYSSLRFLLSPFSDRLLHVKSTLFASRSGNGAVIEHSTLLVACGTLFSTLALVVTWPLWHFALLARYFLCAARLLLVYCSSAACLLIVVSSASYEIRILVRFPCV